MQLDICCFNITALFVKQIIVIWQYHQQKALSKKCLFKKKSKEKSIWKH